jgi:hypothetical protein
MNVDNRQISSPPWEFGPSAAFWFGAVRPGFIGQAGAQVNAGGYDPHRRDGRRRNLAAMRGPQNAMPLKFHDS